MGRFFGFKLHLIINHIGGLLAVKIIPGNTSDAVPVFDMTKNLFGKIFSDKGSISKELFDKLKEKSLTLITSIKKNMKNSLLEIKDKILLRKKSIIETINDQLKNIYQVNHPRHRSIMNSIANIAGTYCLAHIEKKTINPNLAITRSNIPQQQHSLKSTYQPIATNYRNKLSIIPVLLRSRLYL